LGEALRAAGLGPDDNPLKVGIFGAEPWSEEMRLRIEALHGITALDIYGMCEVIGPGVAFECLATRQDLADGRPGGLHVNEDHFFVELVDPVTGAAVPDGAVGEVVFTTLTRQAQPVVRYRTGDLASLNRAPCACGRTTVRMSRLVGRSDDMIIVRGVNVFPSEVEAAILATPELAPHYTIVVDSRGAMAEMVVVCELAGDPGAPDANRAGPDGHSEDVQGDISSLLAERLSHHLAECLGVRARIVIGEPGALPRTEVGKAVRLIRLDSSSPPLDANLAALVDGIRGPVTTDSL
jgi:phenylacetate-CoA ligase